MCETITAVWTGRGQTRWYLGWATGLGLVRKTKIGAKWCISPIRRGAHKYGRKDHRERGERLKEEIIEAEPDGA